VCIAQEGVPEALRDQTKQSSCPANDKCVPAALVHNQPVKCSAGIILGDGVCSDTCFNDALNIVSRIGVLDQSSCAEGEVCIPCRFVPASTPGCNP
jgi:hypothetical protein